jgi:hypothetical protein
MKTKFIIVLFIIFNQFIFGQTGKNDTIKSRIFSFAPVSTKIDRVNGLSAGIGLSEKILLGSNIAKYGGPIQKVNGINLDVNPLGFLWFCFYDPEKDFGTQEAVVLNGLNLSIAGNLRDVNHNGLNLSFYNYSYKMNGVSLAFMANNNNELNGIGAGIFGNLAENGAGLVIGGFNSFNDFKGMQIGLVNRADNFNGLQIGIFNRTKSEKGLQIGLWNKNGKRSLPIINF